VIGILDLYPRDGRSRYAGDVLEMLRRSRYAGDVLEMIDLYILEMY